MTFSAPTASPGSSSIPAGRGPSKHNGQKGHPRRLRGCADSARQGHVNRAHHHCHPATTTASKNNTTLPDRGDTLLDRPPGHFGGLQATFRERWQRHVTNRVPRAIRRPYAT